MNTTIKPILETQHRGFTIKHFKTHIEVWRKGIQRGGNFDKGWKAIFWIDEIPPSKIDRPALDKKL